MEAVRHGLCGVRGVEARRGDVCTLDSALVGAWSFPFVRGNHQPGGIQSFRRHTLRLAGEHESGGFGCYLEVAAVVIEYLMSDNAAGETGGVVPRETDSRYG